MNKLSKIKEECRKNDYESYQRLGEELQIREAFHWAEKYFEKHPNDSIHNEDIKMFFMEEFDYEVNELDYIIGRYLEENFEDD